jgi:hypothetical protein
MFTSWRGSRKSRELRLDDEERRGGSLEPTWVACARGGRVGVHGVAARNSREVPIDGDDHRGGSRETHVGRAWRSREIGMHGCGGSEVGR